MKKLCLVSILLCTLSLLAVKAQPQYNLEQGDTASSIDTIQPSDDSANNTEMQKNNIWVWLMSGTNIWAVAGVLIALFLGIAQVVTSICMFKINKSNTTTAKYLELLGDFSREIYIQKEEKECLIEALKKEGSEGKMVDTVFLVNEALSRNLRDAALRELRIQRKTIKQSTLEEYMNLPSIPPIQAVDFKYKKS